VSRAARPAVAPPLLVIAGPTATGKTALAIEIALLLRAEGTPAEIISADSRQVFRGLDIGTAKPALAERRGVPHQGLDLVDPDAPFSVADFARHVGKALSGIEAGGGLAILAGGTGFYLRAIASGLDTAALPSDPLVRARIEESLATDGIDVVAARLTMLGPRLAAGIDLRNPRRVARALEIVEIAGDVALPAARPYPGQVTWLGLDVEPATHRSWIAHRARAQFDAGLIEEARALRERYDPSLAAFSAIGYREAWGVIDGTLTHEEALELDIARNVAFAKRQRTWFRRERAIDWHDAAAAAGGSDDVSGHAVRAARRLLDEGRNPAGR
jgi:tRNA dimethylallyltransferase